MPLVACKGRKLAKRGKTPGGKAVKTYKNLYEQIYDFDNLHKAYLEARKGKRYRDEVLEYTANLEENLINLQNHLIYQTYKVGAYREKIINIPKKRIIMILPFRDRVLQWAVYRVLNPIFAKSYITDSYGCIKGRGNLAAIKRIQYWLRLLERDKRPIYVLNMDIRKYFFRIPHDVILDIIGRKIADERVMWLMGVLVNSNNTPFGLPLDVKDVGNVKKITGIGVPVGSLNSQMIANIVLNEVDQLAKRELRIPYFIRYVDNFGEISHDKNQLNIHRAIIERFLHENLRLEFSDATIYKVVDGVAFAGYRIWSDRIQLRKATALRMKKRLKHIRQQYAEGKITLEKAVSVFHSFTGLMSHCNNNSLRDKVHEDFVLTKSWLTKGLTK